MAQEKWFIEPGETRVIDVASIGSLKAALFGGQIDVVAHDEPTTRVQVHSVTERVLRVAIDGDRLGVDHVQLAWDSVGDALRAVRDRATADVSVLVPRHVAVTLATGSADALVTGVKRETRISTVSGSVTVDAGEGDLRVDSVSGEVSVRDQSGSLVAHTVSGDVTAGGDLESASVDSVTAEVLLDLTGSPDTATVRTVSGDVTVRLPVDVGGRYRVTGATGAVRLGGRTTRVSPNRPFTSSDGPENGSVAEISVSTVSADVTLLRESDTGTGTGETTAGSADATAGEGATGATEGLR